MNFLFDLDSTLLQMDQDLFIQKYTQALQEFFAKKGKDVKKYMTALFKGVEKMIINSSDKSNEVVFFDSFVKETGEDEVYIKDLFLEFYQNEFHKIGQIVSFNPLSRKIIETLIKKGHKIVCATTPIFPEIATFERLRWAGLNPDMFEFVTTYEHFSGAKPNLHYYQQVLKKASFNPIDTLMVGNDVKEDLVIQKLGVETYLITDYLINKDNIEYQTKYKSTLNELYDFVINL